MSSVESGTVLARCYFITEQGSLEVCAGKLHEHGPATSVLKRFCGICIKSTVCKCWKSRLKPVCQFVKEC